MKQERTREITKVFASNTYILTCDMKMKKQTYKIVLTGLFIAMGYLFPFIIGNNMQLGSIFLPMHIPILLCGFLVGGVWGGVAGASVPILRSVLFGSPPMYPMAISMSVELAVYGFVAGMLYYILVKRKKANKYDLPHLIYTYVALIGAMLVGRIAFGGTMYLLTVISETRPTFTFTAFISGAFTTPWLGIFIQLMLIPPIVVAFERANKRWQNY